MLPWAMQPPKEEAVYVKVPSESIICVSKGVLEVCGAFFKGCLTFNEASSNSGDYSMILESDTNDLRFDVDLASIISADEENAFKSILTFAVYKNHYGSMDIPCHLFKINLRDLVSLLFLADVLNFSSEIEQVLKMKFSESIQTLQTAIWFLELCAEKMKARPVLESQVFKYSKWKVVVTEGSVTFDVFKYFFVALYLLQQDAEQEFVSLLELGQKIEFNLKEVPKVITDSQSKIVKKVMFFIKLLINLS